MPTRELGTLGTVGILIGAGVVIGGLVCLGGYFSRCMKCDKWFSKREVCRVKVKEEAGAKDLDRSDAHYDKDGNYAGKTTRKERVYGKYITFDVTMQCGKCGDSYHETKLVWQDY